MYKQISFLFMLLLFNAANAQHNYKVILLTEYSQYQSPDSLHTDTIGINYSFADSVQINKVLSRYSNTVQVLIVENPSSVLWSVNEKIIPHLQKLILYANDWCTDAMMFMPDALLRLPKLREVVFDGERLPIEEFNRIIKQYPDIKFGGNICDQ